MKKLYKKLFIFISIFALMILACLKLSTREPYRTWAAQLTDSNSFITGNVGSDEIKPYINKVRSEDGTTRLIVGDSVCRQLFVGLQQYNKDIAIVGSNAAITMAGQYILVSEYIANHENATDVYLILLPDTLCRTFDTKWGYQYTVMPFVETDTLQLLDEKTIASMESVYGKFFMKEPVVTAIDKSGVNRKLYLNILKDISDGYEQESKFEIAELYINKMYEICQKNGVKLHLYACPMPETRQEEMKTFREQYKETTLYDIFPDFLENLTYFPPEEAADGVHFSGDYANQSCYNEKIDQMLSDKELGQIIKKE